GKTNAMLTLSNVTFSDRGSYRCGVSNAFGTVVSMPAVLTVLRSAPRFDLAAFTTNGFSLNLAGLSAHGPVLLYVSTNLLDWRPILTNPPVSGPMQLLLPAGDNSPMRAYRAVEQ